jgi:hypothetical protein
MVKKSTVVFTILALLAFGACTCWGYTVGQWPAPGVPNTVFGPSPLVPGHYQTNPYQTPLYNYGTGPMVNPYTGPVGNRSPRRY